MRPILNLAPMLLIPLVCLAQNQRPEKPLPNPFDGARMFQYHCAACHGADARGHGPSAAMLKHAVPDLTVISQRNSGKFPYKQVRDFIEGKESASMAHGDRAMPIWGPIFHQVEADQDWGEIKLEAVTRHVEFIQQK